VPSCAKCNKHLGQLEKDLLIRMAFCLDPHAEAASGISALGLRSLGLDAGELPEKERAHRDRLRAKVRSELIPYAEVADSERMIPGLGPPDNRRSEWAIAIPYAGLSIVAEKFARGCEFKLKGRLVAEPYGLRTSIEESDVIPEPWASAIKRYDFGPGCKIQRLFAREDHNVVLYWISLWGSLCLHVKIDYESELRKADAQARRPQGIASSENHRLMAIPPYLRTVSPTLPDPVPLETPAGASPHDILEGGD
jgi:hypothetical protein